MYGLAPLFQTLNGKCLMSACTSASSNFRPMRRLASKTLWQQSVSGTNSCNGKWDARVCRVHCDLVFSSITDQALGIGEGDVGGGCAVPLIIGDNLNTIVLPDTDATGERIRKESRRCQSCRYSRIGGAQIDTDGFRHYDEWVRERRLGGE
jgi:hypothetical protein